MFVVLILIVFFILKSRFLMNSKQSKCNSFFIVSIKEKKMRRRRGIIGKLFF